MAYDKGSLTVLFVAFLVIIDVWVLRFLPSLLTDRDEKITCDVCVCMLSVLPTVRLSVCRGFLCHFVKQTNKNNK